MYSFQVDPAKYKSIFNGFRVTVAEEGTRALAKGWAPTFIGYSMQGLCKFGFYEVFKALYANMLGEVSNSLKRKGALYRFIVTKIRIYKLGSLHNSFVCHEAKAMYSME